MDRGLNNLSIYCIIYIYIYIYMYVSIYRHMYVLYHIYIYVLYQCPKRWKTTAAMADKIPYDYQPTNQDQKGFDWPVDDYPMTTSQNIPLSKWLISLLGKSLFRGLSHL